MIQDYPPVWDAQTKDLIQGVDTEVIYGDANNKGYIFDIRIETFDGSVFSNIAINRDVNMEKFIIPALNTPYPQSKIIMWGTRLPPINYGTILSQI